MSWYYDYYLVGKRDGKLVPIGPFKQDGTLASVLTKSRSSSSELHEKFLAVDKEMIGKELIKTLISSESGEEDNTILQSFSYLPIRDLPKGSMLKEGYVLTEQLNAYLQDDNCSLEESEGFTDILTPLCYAEKFRSENASKHSPVTEQKDCEGEPYRVYTAADYMFYRWIDTESESYEAYIIRMAYDTFCPYDFKCDEVCVLCWQG